MPKFPQRVPTTVTTTYASGRVETKTYGSYSEAKKVKETLEKMNTVVSVVLKERGRQ